RKISFRPKKFENPAPARLDGLVASSCTTTPLPPVADKVSAPLAKLAEPLPPSAVFSAETKLPTVVPMLVEPTPLTESVPASKSTSTRDTSLPLGSVTAMVVLPLKLSASVDNRLVLRPAMVVGGGTEVLALAWALKASAVFCAKLP